MQWQTTVLYRWGFEREVRSLRNLKRSKDSYVVRWDGGSGGYGNDNDNDGVESDVGGSDAKKPIKQRCAVRCAKSQSEIDRVILANAAAILGVGREETAFMSQSALFERVYVRNAWLDPPLMRHIRRRYGATSRSASRWPCW